jgi:hypothetical protein
MKLGKWLYSNKYFGNVALHPYLLLFKSDGLQCLTPIPAGEVFDAEVVLVS